MTRRPSTFCTWLQRQLQQRRSLYIGGSMLILAPGVVYCGESSAPTSDTVGRQDSAIVDATGDRGSANETFVPDAPGDSKTPADLAGDSKAPADLAGDTTPTLDGPTCNPSTPGADCTTSADCPPDLVCYAPICIIPCPPSCQPIPCDPKQPSDCSPYKATCKLFCGKYQCTH